MNKLSALIRNDDRCFFAGIPGFAGGFVERWSPRFEEAFFMPTEEAVKMAGDQVSVMPIKSTIVAFDYKGIHHHWVVFHAVFIKSEELAIAFESWMHRSATMKMNSLENYLINKHSNSMITIRSNRLLQINLS